MMKFYIRSRGKVQNKDYAFREVNISSKILQPLEKNINKLFESMIDSIIVEQYKGKEEKETFTLLEYDSKFYMIFRKIGTDRQAFASRTIFIDFIIVSDLKEQANVFTRCIESNKNKIKKLLNIIVIDSPMDSKEPFKVDVNLFQKEIIDFFNSYTSTDNNIEALCFYPKNKIKIEKCKKKVLLIRILLSFFIVFGVSGMIFWKNKVQKGSTPIATNSKTIQLRDEKFSKQLENKKCTGIHEKALIEEPKSHKENDSNIENLIFATYIKTKKRNMQPITLCISIFQLSFAEKPKCLQNIKNRNINNWMEGNFSK